jgi:hypothetical protein
MTKAAIDYLKASGATSISIIEVHGVCRFQVGHKIDPAAGLIQWLPETMAPKIVKLARRHAGNNPDAARAMAALHQAAKDHRVTLTPHRVALDRAAAASARLDAYLEASRASGVLQAFNAEFKRRRTEAKAAGVGFMSYSVATARLRRALIPLLMSGGTPQVGQTLLGEVFR